MNRFRPRLAAGTAPVLLVLLVLLVALALKSDNYHEVKAYVTLLKRAAPLAILAIGQYFVIVTGEFDLSVGSLVTAEVVIAAQLIDGDDSATPRVWLIMFVIGVIVGLVNGIVTTRLLVPSFITTLGTLLILKSLAFRVSGGSPQGNLGTTFRVPGRKGFNDFPLLGQLPYSVLVLAVVAIAAVLFMRSATGRTVLAVGDNDRAARLAGVRVESLRTLAFVISAVLAALAAVIIAGFSGVSAQVGAGLEFRAITAVVLGGVLLGGGRGSVVAALVGAVTLEALFTLLTLLGVDSPLQPTVQGIIIVAAVAFASLSSGRRRRPDAVPHPAPAVA